VILTYKFRIKDATSRKCLEAHSRAVNFVWNFCCETQRKAESKWKAGGNGKWPSHFDLTRLCSGAGAELGIGTETMGEICRIFATSRFGIRRTPKFRASGGAKRSLGWIPFRGRFIKAANGVVTWYGQKFRFWQSRDLGGPVKTGAFVQDARGRWYVTFQCEVEEALPTGNGRVGIDLGLKTLATCSNGETVPALQHYRKYEDALATAQRAGNRRRVQTIHAKIANARRDQLHKASTRIARENSLIVVGNVNVASLKKTRMAKSVSDASWSMFRTMLRYKASRHGATFIEADERFTSQTCSACGTIPASSPKGMGALGVRRWECSDCGADHDRDVNAAQNILRVGLECQPPVAGIAA
jgi:putative transposase